MSSKRPTPAKRKKSLKSTGIEKSPPPNYSVIEDVFSQVSVKRLAKIISTMPIIQLLPPRDISSLAASSDPQAVFHWLMSRQQQHLTDSQVKHETAPASPHRSGPNRGTNILTYKVGLFGAPGVGKSNLIKELKCVCGSSKDCLNCSSKVKASITIYESPGVYRLCIVDPPAGTAHTPLGKQYLKNPDCAMFVFSFDNSSSLDQWVEYLKKEFEGSMEHVKKFVVGTKMDAGFNESTAKLQDKALSFARQMNAEFCIIPANNPGKVHELFERVGDALVEKTPFIEPKTLYDYDYDNHDRLCYNLDNRALILQDVLTPPGALLRYPDPVAFNMGKSEITDITLTRRSLVMSGEDEEFSWGTDLYERLQEPVTIAASPTAPSTKPTNLPDSEDYFELSASTWQQKDTLGDCVLGVTMKRQPTCTEFRDIKELLFSSTGNSEDTDREKGLFYMLMLTTDGKVLECGLNPAQAEPENSTIRREFLSTPKPLALQSYDTVKSMSMSSTHAAVVLDDGRVIILGDHVPQKVIIERQVLYPERQVAKVACGVDFTLMLTNDGTVLSYGNGQYGQLGHGDEENKTTPTMIKSLSRVQTIAAGNHYAVATAFQLFPRNHGVIYQWGMKCEDLTMKEFVKKPTKYKARGNITVTSVSCGAHHILCLGYGYRRLTEPYSAGYGARGQLGHGNLEKLGSLHCIEISNVEKNAFEKVSAGKNHSAILTKDGSVFTFGCNKFGQLGYFTKTNHSSTPETVRLGHNTKTAEIRAKDVSCSEDCTTVLTKDNEVLIWGKGFYGAKIQNSLPIELNASTVVDVATCKVPCENGWTEMAFALRESQPMLLLFRVGRFSFDFQTMRVAVPCSVRDLVSLTSVGPILAAVDKNGTMHFADSQVWCKEVLSSAESASHSTDPARSLSSSIHKLKSSNTKLPQLTWMTCDLSEVAEVKATLDTFFIGTSVGDVYSWKPFLEETIGKHIELDNRIVMTITCGLQHAVVLTDDGEVLTCGNGSSGQLGHGTYENVSTFEPVPLMDSCSVGKICCGYASTAVLTKSGKVFFWGELDVLEKEKQWQEMRSLKASRGEAIRLPKIEARRRTSTHPYAYELSLEDEGQEQQVAVIGKPFEFRIKPINTQENGTTASEEIFKVEACSGDQPTKHAKGKVKQDDNGTLTGSIVFCEKATYQVLVTCDNLTAVQKSPFMVRAEEKALPRRCRLSLLGQQYDSVRDVGIVLNLTESRASFKDAGLRVELWGVPGDSTDQTFCDAVALTTMIDGGIYVYVWDGLDGDLPRENLKFWLQTLSRKAPHAEFVLLGINIHESLTDHLVLNPYKEINPKFKRALMLGSLFSSAEFSTFANKMASILQAVQHSKEVVSIKMEDLATRIQEIRGDKDGTKTLDKQHLKSLARDCGISGEYQFTKAASYLEEAGLGLTTGREKAFLVLKENWIKENVLKISMSCTHGVLDSSKLDDSKECIKELLIRKQLAFADKDEKRIHVVPFLEPQAEGIWKPVDNEAFTTSRHLLLAKEPSVLHTIFPVLMRKAVHTYSGVFIAKDSFVISGKKYKCRVDYGPSLVERNESEIRVVVRADSPENCRQKANSIAASILQLISESSHEWSVSFSCFQCMSYYIKQCDLQAAEAEGEIFCHGCKQNVTIATIIDGHKEDKSLPDWEWTGRAGERPVSRSHTLPRDFVQPVIKYLDEKLQNQEQKLLSEIKQEFSKLTRLLTDIEECTVPRTVCILPNKGRIPKLSPKWRIFLLCEGNGDGTGIHFLDPDDHKGYVVNTFDKAIRTVIPILRLCLKLILMYFCDPLAVALDWLFPTGETLIAVLAGGVGSKALLHNTDWERHFREVDRFLKRLEESGQPLSKSNYHAENRLHTGSQFRLHSHAYKKLKNVLSPYKEEDDFGGLVKEHREGVGFVWVCKQHKKIPDAITSTSISKPAKAQR